MNRIYTTFKLPENIKIDNISKYLIYDKEKTRFLTDEGIFEIKGQNVHKIIITDNIINYKIIMINDEKIELVIDKCDEYLNNNFSYYIPNGYILNKYNERTYRLLEHAEVKFIVIIKDNIIEDYYFETKQNYNEPEVINTITTFLSLL